MVLCLSHKSWRSSVGRPISKRQVALERRPVFFAAFSRCMLTLLCTQDLSKVVAMVSCFPDAVRLVLSQSRSVDYEYDDYPLDKQDDRVALLLQDLRTTQIVRLSVSNPDGITQWWRTSSQEDFVVQEK